MPSPVSHYTRRIPFRWFAGGVAVIGLGVSGLFNGLAPVGAAQTPRIAVGTVIDAGPWNVTIVHTRVLASSADLKTTTDGDRWFAVVATVDDTTQGSRDQLSDIVWLPHVAGLRTAEPQEVLLASDATLLGYLNPGMPERVAFLWEQSSTVPLPKTADILRDYTINDPEALIFTGAKGAALRRSNFRTASHWTASVMRAGLPGFYFHDLRHTGNTLASRTGASLADLMARMGHSSTRAALIYQHTAHEQDREIAAALSSQIDRERQRARNGYAKQKK